MNGKTIFGIEDENLKNRLDEIGDSRLGGIVLDGARPIPKDMAELERMALRKLG